MNTVLMIQMSPDELRTMLIEVVKELIAGIPDEPKEEIIDRAELCKRLNLSEPTIIRWEKKGKIPSLRVGGIVRYNWPAVLKALARKAGK